MSVVLEGKGLSTGVITNRIHSCAWHPSNFRRLCELCGSSGSVYWRFRSDPVGNDKRRRPCPSIPYSNHRFTIRASAYWSTLLPSPIRYHQPPQESWEFKKENCVRCQSLRAFKRSGQLTVHCRTILMKCDEPARKEKTNRKKVCPITVYIPSRSP